MITTETAHHPLPDGQLDLLGAISNVTPAMTRVVVGGMRFLVDCGVAQGRAARDFRFPSEAAAVDVVVLTHGHFDHVGNLPLLLEHGFSGPVFGTRATLEIAATVIDDSLRLQGYSNQDRSRFARRLGQLRQITPYGRRVTLTGFDGTLTLREAGHILGSSSLDFNTNETRLIISGDLGRPDAPILRDPCTDWGARPTELVLMESTYGNRLHQGSHAQVEADLETIVQAAAERRGHILVPAFAIGRTQTLLYHLNTLVEARRIPELMVAVDTPMGLSITDTYQDSRRLFDRDALARIDRGDDPLDFDRLYSIKRGSDSVRLRDLPGPVLIIAGSGMCTGGRIVGHLRELLPLESTTVLFVGYQAHGTPGRAIQNAAREGGHVELDRERLPVRAHIETLSGLSAHADQSELLHWLSHIPTPRRVALHHGEPEAQRALRDKIEAMNLVKEWREGA